jgi:hypothetical protein
VSRWFCLLREVRHLRNTSLGISLRCFGGILDLLVYATGPVLHATESVIYKSFCSKRNQQRRTLLSSCTLRRATICLITAPTCPVLDPPRTTLFVLVPHQSPSLTICYRCVFSLCIREVQWSVRCNRVARHRSNANS